VKPSDISRIVTVSEPALSPDGAYVAYTVRRVDADANRYRSAVWLAATDGSEPPRQVTSGEESDGSPIWSPGSDRVAFVSTRGEDEKRKNTLHVISVRHPGETITLATRDEGIGSLAWSSDGRRLAFASRVRAERYADGDDDRARPPRKIDRLFPRLDSEGWTIDRPTQLFVVPADGSAEPRQVTRDTYEWSSPTWAPDSRRLAATAARQEDFDLDVYNDVWVIHVDDVDLADDSAAPTPRPVTNTDASHMYPSWQPDGEQIAVLWSTGRVGYRHVRVALVDAASGETTVLTSELDLTCAPYPGERPPVWSGGRIYFPVEERGSVPLMSVAATGGDLRREIGGTRCLTGYDVVTSGSPTIAFTATAPDLGAGEVFVQRDGSEQQLTTHQATFLAACPPCPTEHFTVTSPSGMELDAWAVLPPEYDSAGSYPALLNIHGGPHTQYGERWFDEFQLYASAGYVVVFSNPRGSTGYDEASARSLISAASSEDPSEGWADPAFADLMAVMDAACERYPAIDSSRLGVMGGSYGGYMTSWIIGHTDRFAAACSERAVNNIASLEWSSDAAGYFRFAMGATHLDAPEEYARLSPITYVRDIQTPVLILHSEQDLRCPVEQADALFVALRLLGKPVEYYRFPEESHELTRSGSPKHRAQRAELVLDWFGRTLKAR
jgi:dipeptidyl aminopeptidase/acylaminoacyl peptidase